MVLKQNDCWLVPVPSHPRRRPLCWHAKGNQTVMICYFVFLDKLEPNEISTITKQNTREQSFKLSSQMLDPRRPVRFHQEHLFSCILGIMRLTNLKSAEENTTAANPSKTTTRRRRLAALALIVEPARQRGNWVSTLP